MTFDEAIDAVTDQPELCLTGIALDRRGDWMTVYFLSSEGQTVEMFSERAQLFSQHLVHCELEIESAPTEALLLDYGDHSGVFGSVGVSEQALSTLLPSLPDPGTTEPAEFKALAVQAAEASGFLTLVEPQPGEAV